MSSTCAKLIDYQIVLLTNLDTKTSMGCQELLTQFCKFIF